MTRKDCCTLYPEGDWSMCCLAHDYACADAEAKRSVTARLDADLQLRRCVESKGHPIHAAIMYAGVRAWAVLKGGY